MPANTVVPSDCRISEPAPVATTSGATPRINANKVIRIGRSRVRAAVTAASPGVAPSSVCRCEFHNQNRVLGRQAEENDEIDLHQNIDCHIAHQQTRYRGKKGTLERSSPPQAVVSSSHTVLPAPGNQTGLPLQTPATPMFPVEVGLGPAPMNRGGLQSPAMAGLKCRWRSSGSLRRARQ
jgi:hypothetical protein